MEYFNLADNKVQDGTFEIDEAEQLRLSQKIGLAKCLIDGRLDEVIQTYSAMDLNIEDLQAGSPKEIEANVNDQMITYLAMTLRREKEEKKQQQKILADLKMSNEGMREKMKYTTIERQTEAANRERLE